MSANYLREFRRWQGNAKGHTRAGHQYTQCNVLFRRGHGDRGVGKCNIDDRWQFGCCVPCLSFSGTLPEGLSSKGLNPTCDISEGMQWRVRVKGIAPKVRLSKGYTKS